MVRAGILLAALALALHGAPAASAAGRDVRAYRVGQALALEPGQVGTYTLACRPGDVVTDGVWRVDAVDADAQPDGQAFDRVTGVDVLEADAFSQGGYRFRLRDNAAGRAQVHLAIVCLRARVGARRLRVLGRRETTAALLPGSGGPRPVSCPRGALAIAPGFRLDGSGGAARLTASYPVLPSLARSRLTFTALDAVAVTASGRCLRRRTTAAHGRRDRLRVALRAGDTAVADGRMETFTVSCRAREAAIVGDVALGDAWYLGQWPAERRRAYELQSPSTGRPGHARLGLLCLRERTSEPR